SYLGVSVVRCDCDGDTGGRLVGWGIWNPVDNNAWQDHSIPTEKRGPRITPVPVELLSSASGRTVRVLHESVRRAENPTESDLDQDRNLVGLPHRHTVNGRGVRDLDADLVGVAVAELREVTADNANARVRRLAEVAADRTAVVGREAEQVTAGRSEVQASRVSDVAVHVTGNLRTRKLTTETGVNGPAVELVVLGNQVVALKQTFNHVAGAEVDLVGGVRQDVSGVDTGQSGTAQRLTSVEHGKVDTATNGVGHVGLNLGVQAVRVGPRELLRHRAHGRKLDRGERPGTPADARGRLNATLALLVGGTPADLADLGALRVHRNNGLAVADRDLLAQTEDKRALLGLLEHRSDDLLRQKVA